MPEFRENENDNQIDRPPAYRTLLIAFLIWTAHFAVSYGGVLVFPEGGIARLIAIIAGLIAVVALLLQFRRLPGPRSPFSLGALGLVGVAIFFGTFPAIIG